VILNVFKDDKTSLSLQFYFR